MCAYGTICATAHFGGTLLGTGRHDDPRSGAHPFRHDSFADAAGSAENDDRARYVVCDLLRLRHLLPLLYRRQNVCNYS